MRKYTLIAREYISRFFKNLHSFWSPIILGASTLIVSHKIYVVLSTRLSPLLFSMVFVFIGGIITYTGISGRKYN